VKFAIVAVFVTVSGGLSPSILVMQAVAASVGLSGHRRLYKGFNNLRRSTVHYGNHLQRDREAGYSRAPGGTA
jgi:hypothetical protein